MKLRAILAILAAALLLVATAPAASATTGGDVFNRTSSVSWVDIWNSSGSVKRLYAGQDSINYSAWSNDVQAFRVSSNCRARSQYSPAGSYPYAGGVKYWMSHNDVNLALYVNCYV